MKTIEITVYSFNELSDKSKEKARNNYRVNDCSGYFWWSESFDSLQTFCNKFNVKIKDYEVSHYGYSWVKTDVINQNFRGLKLKTIDRDYMPTGYCMDCSLWITFYDVFKQTGNALQAFNEAIDQWVKDTVTDMEDQNSDEYIDQHMTMNDYEFYENGVMA